MCKPVKRGNTYYFRRRIPQDLLARYAPAKEVTKSVKTSDYHEAKRRCHALWLEYERAFEAARREAIDAPAIRPQTAVEELLEYFQNPPPEPRPRLLTAEEKAESERLERAHWEDQEMYAELIFREACKPLLDENPKGVAWSC